MKFDIIDVIYKMKYEFGDSASVNVSLFGSDISVTISASDTSNTIGAASSFPIYFDEVEDSYVDELNDRFNKAISLLKIKMKESISDMSRIDMSVYDGD